MSKPKRKRNRYARSPGPAQKRAALRCPEEEVHNGLGYLEGELQAGIRQAKLLSRTAATQAAGDVCSAKYDTAVSGRHPTDHDVDDSKLFVVDTHGDPLLRNIDHSSSRPLYQRLPGGDDFVHARETIYTPVALPYTDCLPHNSRGRSEAPVKEAVQSTTETHRIPSRTTHDQVGELSLEVPALQPEDFNWNELEDEPEAHSVSRLPQPPALIHSLSVSKPVRPARRTTIKTADETEKRRSLETSLDGRVWTADPSLLLKPGKKARYYGVRAGRQIGIFYSWPET